MNWLKHNYHSLTWQEGYVPYKEISKILFDSLRRAKKNYVKGLEKKIWLAKRGINAINVEDLNIKYRIQDDCNQGLLCLKHGNMGSSICALRNVFYLRKKMMYCNFFFF